MLPFYRDVLGFALSDYILKPFKAYFFHVNPRHHSLAFIETGKNGMHHMMVELFSLDDVGQAYDIALTRAGAHRLDARPPHQRPRDVVLLALAVRLHGRVRLGRALVTPGNWTAEEYTVGPSLWGHERDWLPEEKRAEARAMRMKLAEDGVRHPVQVIDGNYRLMPGTCPWWDRAIAPRKAG